MRDEPIRREPQSQRKIETGQRPADRVQPAPRPARDPVHLEERESPAGILDQRRGGIERFEHLGPEYGVADRIVDDRPRLVGDGLGLNQRHPAAHPEPRRRERAIHHAAALEGVGDDDRGTGIGSLAQPRDRKPEGRDPSADDGHGTSVIRTYVRFIPSG